MPESIIVPEVDTAYDLAFLYPLQQALLPFEPWWELVLWLIFGSVLIWQGYQLIIKPNFLS